MGFSSGIRQDALVAAARHCCVCHRYKGLKVEVHHIVQEANGGPNTFENAIALCFDCHADAGHYNDNHPKGTKFSIPELIKARNEWYQIVREHRIQIPVNTSNHLHFRHMVLQDYITANEIFSGDLKEFPFPNTTLLRNEILKFLTPLFSTNDHHYHVGSVEYRGFQTTDEVFASYSDAQYTDKSGGEFPYFHITRTPKREELLSIRKKLDPFICHLLDSNIEPGKFCSSTIYQNYVGCGDDTIGNPPYIEYISFRKLWFSFLSITNISAAKVELQSLLGKEQTKTSALTNVLKRMNETDLNLSFPKIALLPNETIIVPSALILVPFEEELFTETIVSDQEMNEPARSQVLTHLIRDVKETNFEFIGKYINPTSIIYNADDWVNTSEMHELDLNNLVVLNRWWHMGSCPHLFFRRSDLRLEYVKELFTQTPGAEMTEQIIVPENIIGLTIAELEDETTYINEIKINSKVVYSDIVLNKGQILELDVMPKDILEVKGYYVHGEINVREDDKHLMRNMIIQKFLKQDLVA